MPSSETQVYLQVSRRVQPKIDNEIVKSSLTEKYILLLLREFCSVGAWLRNLRFIGFPNPMKIRGICLSGFGNPYTKKWISFFSEQEGGQSPPGRGFAWLGGSVACSIASGIAMEAEADWMVLAIGAASVSYG